MSTSTPTDVSHVHSHKLVHHRRRIWHLGRWHEAAQNKRTVAKSAFLVSGLILSCTLSQSVSMLIHTYKYPQFWHTVVLEIWFVAVLLLGAVFFPFYREHYGMSLKRIKADVLLGAASGLGGAVLATIVRLRLIDAGYDELSYRVTPLAVFFTVTNLFTVVLQELVAKGYFQNGIRSLIDPMNKSRGRGRVPAIVLTSLVFAQFHVVYGVWVVAVAFVYSLITGWIYEKTRSILGISIFHYFLGIALFHFSNLA